MAAPQNEPHLNAAGPEKARRLFVYSAGFLTQSRVRRILTLSGWRLAFGKPFDGDYIGLWGQSPTAHRGEAVALRTGVPTIRVEDAFLRSLFPGRKGEPPIGLLIDQRGLHFDPSQPSDLEHLLATDPLDDTGLLDRARGAIARLQEAHLSKYSAFEVETPAPDPGYVLVIDQTRGDASVKASRGDLNRFREMLFVAREEHPNARIVIKTHPESQQGFRPGYFGPNNLGPNITLCDTPISPWKLLDGAIAVYTVSSGMGFEAILAGHKPRVFGQPFYAGWGLTQDEVPLARRQRNLTRAQLFAAAMILYPRWYDPFNDRLCQLEDAISTLEAQSRAWRADHKGWVASGMRLWKRPALQQVFGQNQPVKFIEAPKAARAAKRPWMVWSGKAGPEHQGAVRVEDGFLRSRGLGAELVPPLSLVTDDLGIYYDPGHPSRLEALIKMRQNLRPDQQLRAERLQRRILAAGISKYNLSGNIPDLPPGPRILVVGQVEDDASIRLGAGDICTNRGLLEAARAAHPDTCLIYKPHPDVEAGLRAGHCDAEDIADVIASGTNIHALLSEVDMLWTMTSLTGFEALLRGVKVTTTGAPFYAGWGLTKDIGEIPKRRNIDVALTGLIHASLIDYPRYFDPKTGMPCPPEIAVERLADGDVPHQGRWNRTLAKLQGAFASYAFLWR